MNACSNIKLPTINFNCNNAPYHPLKKILMRIKEGKLQVMINGKGKWIPANYDKENGIITW